MAAEFEKVSWSLLVKMDQEDSNKQQPEPHLLCWLQDAFGMLAEMGKEGVMPTVDTFNTLMDACIRRVNPAAVPRLFNQMEQSGVCWPSCAQTLFAQDPHRQ